MRARKKYSKGGELYHEQDKKELKKYKNPIKSALGMFEQGGEVEETEFRSSSRQRAESMLDDYLRSKGFTQGRSDKNAPKYKLFQDENSGDYIYRKS